MPAEVTSGPSVTSPRLYSPPSEREEEAREAEFTGLQDLNIWFDYLLEKTRELSWMPVFGQTSKITSLDFQTRDPEGFWLLNVEGESVEVTFEQAGPTADSVSSYQLISDEPVERWNLDTFLRWSPTPKPEGQITASVERAERPPMEWEF